MMPGMSASPSASTTCLPESDLPTSEIIPSFTARFACCGGEPLPSSSRAFRITRSCIASQYTCRVKLFELDHKVAIITGAGRGIGAATAELFASAGAAVAVLDKYENYAVRTADTIRRSGGHAIAVTCDVNNEEEVEEVFEGIAKELGAIDILVNNAGRAIRKPAIEVPLA